MSDDYVVLLGSKGGPAIRPGSSMPTSHLLSLNDQQIIVDCGLGVSQGLVTHGMNLKDISLIFITHLHSDHYLELGPLLHTAWTSGLKNTVHVWGPPGLHTYWKHFLSSMEDDITLRIHDEGRPNLKNLVSLHPLHKGIVTSHHNITVSAIHTLHPPLIDTFALSFKTPKTHVVFSGDTAPLKELETFAFKADLLLHEAMLESALPSLLARIGNGSEKLMAHWLRSHTFAHDAAKIATNAQVKQLALNHLIPADDPLYTDTQWQKAVKPFWNGPLHIGKDGLSIPIHKPLDFSLKNNH